MGFNAYGVNNLHAVNKSELLIGEQVERNIVDKRGVLLLTSGSTMTDRIKARLCRWGKVFFE